jgi:hypothetical protein
MERREGNTPCILVHKSHWELVLGAEKGDRVTALCIVELPHGGCCISSLTQLDSLSIPSLATMLHFSAKFSWHTQSLTKTCLNCILWPLWGCKRYYWLLVSLWRGIFKNPANLLKLFGAKSVRIYQPLACVMCFFWQSFGGDHVITIRENPRSRGNYGLSKARIEVARFDSWILCNSIKASHTDVISLISIGERKL